MYHATGHVDKNSHGLPYQMRSVLALLTQRNFCADFGLILTLEPKCAARRRQVERRVMRGDDEMEKRTVFFTMVMHPANGWTRVGNAYPSRKAAADWLPFVRGAWRGVPANTGNNPPEGSG